MNKSTICSDMENRTLIEKSESHVIILFLFRFLLLGRSSISSWGSSTTSGRGSGTTCRGSSKSRPVWLYFNTSSLQDGRDLLWGDGNIIISQNKGSVNTCEFGVCHFKVLKFPRDLAQREQGTGLL